MLTGISSPSSSHVQPCCLYTPQPTEKDNHLKALVTTSNNFFTKTYQLQSLTNVLSTKPLIGASLSEPHIDQFVVESVYIIIYIYIVCRAASHFRAPILRVLASFINSKTIHQLLSEKTRTAVPPRWQQQGQRPLADLPIQ